jgi:hypothetical protein
MAIKSLAPFVGEARNISFTNIVLEEVEIAMAFNFFHQGSSSSGKTDEHRVGATALSVLIENVTGTVRTSAGHIDCLGTAPCRDVRMVNVNLGKETNGYDCMNVSGTYENCSPVPCGWSEKKVI